MSYSEPDSGTRTLTFPELLTGVDVHSAGAQGLSPAWAAIAIAERLAAVLALLVLLPLLATAGLIIWFLSRRPPLVAHARVGQGGSTVWVLKLRSMWPPVAGRWQPGFIERLKAEPVPELKSPHDARITSRFAAFCRKFSIDELPQLWHVAQGKLSLVGPRPMTAEELSDHYGTDAGTVLRVKPGLTGLWQTRGRSSLNYRRRRRYDLFLVRKASLRLYVAILLSTLPKVLAGKDAW